jgi:predicted  nucleic acid-binding Zn-ribbon protein
MNTRSETVINSCPPGGWVTAEAVRKYTRQYETEKEEMNLLNDKLSGYLRDVKGLEDENLRLQNQLDDIKQNWGKTKRHSYVKTERYLACRFV